jgi:dTDP-4-amino-4,6-dideoxygalactose transaminase
MKPRPVSEIWNYQQIDLGFNYRMTELQAALGISQMERLDEFVTKRHLIAMRYDQLLESLSVTTPWQAPESYSSYHLYIIRLKLDKIGKTQRQIYDSFHMAGILVNLHYIPVYRQPYYEAMGFCAGYCPEAERFYHEAISIPLFPGRTDVQQDRVVAVMGDMLRR